eukprot:scaffold14623_cov134-Isochrysis_galbana.AAC.1
MRRAWEWVSWEEGDTPAPGTKEVGGRGEVTRRTGFRRHVGRDRGRGGVAFGCGVGLLCRWETVTRLWPHLLNVGLIILHREAHQRTNGFADDLERLNRHRGARVWRWEIRKGREH